MLVNHGLSPEDHENKPNMTKQKQKQKQRSQKQSNALTSNSSSRPVNVPAALSAVGNNVLNSLTSIRVKHTESIGTFTVSAAGAPENAGNFQPGTLLPWCKGLAANYEKYEPHMIRIRYVPSVSTATGGLVSMLFDTDPYDILPGNVTDMLSSSLGVSGPSWAPLTLTIPQSVLKSYHRYYTRVGGVPGDMKTYDLGKLVIAHSATTSTSGYIFVDYDISFHVPQISVVPSGNIEDESPNVIGNDYGLSLTTSTTGKIPATVAMPTASQIAAGATAGFQVLNMAANSQGVINLRSAGVGATIVNGLTSDGLTKIKMTNDMSDGGEVMTAWKFICDNSPSFIQPIVTDATNVVTAIAVLLSAGRYSSLDI